MLRIRSPREREPHRTMEHVIAHHCSAFWDQFSSYSVDELILPHTVFLIVGFLEGRKVMSGGTDTEDIPKCHRMPFLHLSDTPRMSSHRVM